MIRPAFALLASLVLTAPALGAQRSYVPVSVGARVRVAAPPRLGWTTGAVAAADTARIVVRSDPGAAADTFMLASVHALETSRGRPRVRRAAGWAALGALVAGAVGATVTAAEARGEYAGYATAAVGLGAAVFGGVVGGTLGALTAPERWGPVIREPR